MVQPKCDNRSLGRFSIVEVEQRVCDLASEHLGISRRQDFARQPPD